MPSRRHLRGTLATVALATASLAFAATADARPTSTKPTVVLVHGAFADASGFGAVIDRLRDDGYPVRAAPNPLVDALTVEPAWKTIPSWYLVSKQDQAMAPDLERLQARRMHAHTSQIDSSHAVYLSHPKAVADLVEQAARATR